MSCLTLNADGYINVIKTGTSIKDYVNFGVVAIGGDEDELTVTIAGNSYDVEDADNGIVRLIIWSLTIRPYWAVTTYTEKYAPLSAAGLLAGEHIYEISHHVTLSCFFWHLPWHAGPCGPVCQSKFSAHCQ